MVIDSISFAGELDMLEIRLNLLDEYVDRFVIVEGAETFSGKPKPLYLIENFDRFRKWKDKIVYYVVSDYENKEILKQLEERDYVDSAPFKRAFYQKEMIRKVIESLSPKDDDVIYYGDCDEVYKIKEIDNKVYKLRQLAYSYYLNNRSPEDWRGTVVTKWKNLKKGCLNDMRAKPINILEDGGWHFTNLGGADAVRKKIESYDHQEVNIPLIKDKIDEMLESNEDFLQRGFKFWVDESELPEYILVNKDKWIQKGLWKS